jgi:hypothetical protein
LVKAGSGRASAIGGEISFWRSQGPVVGLARWNGSNGDLIAARILGLFLLSFHAPIAVITTTGAPPALGPRVFLDLIVLLIHREKAPS